MLGAMLSPFDSYLITRGLKTLALRMERQCNNALEISQFLQKHKAIERVHYPGLLNHPQHDLANRLLMHQRYGGLLSFELKKPLAKPPIVLWIGYNSACQQQHSVMCTPR